MFSILNAKGSKFWGQTIIFTMKYLEIRESFIDYCSPLESTSAFAYKCVDLICTIYESGVLALGGGGGGGGGRYLSKTGIATH